MSEQWKLEKKESDKLPIEETPSSSERIDKCPRCKAKMPAQGLVCEQCKFSVDFDSHYEEGD